MGGTSLDTSIEERAVHEAGHVLLAYAHRALYSQMLWATLLPEGRSGGSCGFGESEVSPDIFVAVSVAGIWAETRSRVDKALDAKIVAGLPCDERHAEEIWDNALYTSLKSGHDDIQNLWSILNGLEVDDEDREAYFERGKMLAFQTIQACWNLVRRLASELADAEHQTMYYDEAFRMLDALRSSKPVVIGELITYRETRRPKTPPVAWHDRGPWFEGFDEWYERDPILPGESYSQWRMRRLR